MVRNAGKLRAWAAAAALLLGSGGAYGFYLVGGGAAQAVVASPGPVPFNAIIYINPNPAAAGGFGDVIAGIEEGRDNISHFATIAVWISPANPANAVLAPLGPPLAVPPPVQPLPPAPPIPAPTVYGPPPGPGFILCQFLYRATNDPTNPGWGALPGAAGDVADDVAACHAVAEQLTTFRQSVAAGIGGGNAWPWLNLEVDLAPVNPTYFEFYKFRAVH